MGQEERGGGGGIVVLSFLLFLLDVREDETCVGEGLRCAWPWRGQAGAKS